MVMRVGPGTTGRGNDLRVKGYFTLGDYVIGKNLCVLLQLNH